MKRFVSVFALLVLTAGPAFAAPLFAKSYKQVDEGEPAKRVVETFKSAMESKTANAVQKAVKALKKSLLNQGTVGEVTERDLFQIESGKGGASSYGHEFLVGIPVTMDGTGLIEKYEIYFHVYYSSDMATGVESVTIDKQVELK